jgi:uncharacterized membrane protein
MIERILQGEWLNHPLHPALVHIPVSMWIASVVFDLLGLAGIADQAVMARLAFYAILLGLVVVLVAIPTGIADWFGIRKEKPAWTLGIFHMALNWIASLAFSVSLGMRSRQDSSIDSLAVILSLVGVGILLVSAYLGGRMTYAYGISVARHSKKRWQRIAEAGKAHISASEGGSDD